MMAVALLTLGAGAILVDLGAYQECGWRAVRTEGLARVLDIEMEKLRACPTQVCLKSQVARGAGPESDTWVRATIQRSLQPGPDGTVHVRLEAAFPEGPTHRLEALLWVKP